MVRWLGESARALGRQLNVSTRGRKVSHRYPLLSELHVQRTHPRADHRTDAGRGLRGFLVFDGRWVVGCEHAPHEEARARSERKPTRVIVRAAPLVVPRLTPSPCRWR